MTIVSKPKPAKRSRKKRESLTCNCMYPNSNRSNLRICGKCGKPLNAKKYFKILVRVSDSLLREIVLARDGFCVCPTPVAGRHGDKRQNGHLITRNSKSVKYDLRNCNEQCDICNMLHEQRPEIYIKWYEDKFGKPSFDRLYDDSWKTLDLSHDYLETIIKELNEIRELQFVDKSFKPRFSQGEIVSGDWKRQYNESRVLFGVSII